MERFLAVRSAQRSWVSDGSSDGSSDGVSQGISGIAVLPLSTAIHRQSMVWGPKLATVPQAVLIKFIPEELHCPPPS